VKKKAYFENGKTLTGGIVRTGCVGRPIGKNNGQQKNKKTKKREKKSDLFQTTKTQSPRSVVPMKEVRERLGQKKDPQHMA